MMWRAMRIPLLLFIAGLCLAVAALTELRPAAGEASSAPSPCTAPSCGVITHIVFIDKENRSFDSIFGRFPGADGATTYIGQDGQTYPLTRQTDALDEDI